MMDFNHSTEEEMLRESVTQFVDAECVLPRSNFQKRDLWHRFAELGWLGIGIPQQAGGYDASLTCVMIVNSVLGGAPILEPFVGSAVLTPQTFIAALGAEASAPFVQPGVEGTQVWALANAEYEASGRLSFVHTSAERNDKGFTLRGKKSTVLGGHLATHFLVAARTEGAVDSQHGITLFSVRRDEVGLTVRNYEMIDSSQVADLELDDVHIPVESVIGKHNSALAAIETGTDIAIIASLFGVVGAMDRALRLTNDYVRTRKQFGRILWDLQVVKHRLADMLVSLEHARSAAYRGLSGLYETDVLARARAVSSAKIVVSRCSKFVCGQALHLHGGMGLTDELPVSHLFKYAAVNTALFGSESYHVGRLGSLM
jgi:alkylation response protein AidB-like acyl-CoA dehydrogenase